MYGFFYFEFVDDFLYSGTQIMRAVRELTVLRSRYQTVVL